MSIGTATQDASGRRDAARALLQQPILVADRDPGIFTLVRRHAKALRTMFAERLGYTLVVDADFARLVKTAPSPGGPVRPLRRADGSDFGAVGYVYLALVCAALLAPGTGDRISLSALVDRVHTDADAHGIRIPDGRAERRHLVAALRVLTDWGVLDDTEPAPARSDGAATADDPDDGGPVLSVRRPLLTALTTGPLHHLTAPATVGAGSGRETARVRLYRRLVEDPVVDGEDLNAETREVLIRDRAALAQDLDEDFGLVLEVRTEGALAYDPEGALTDESFPDAGTVKQAALLLVAALLDDATPTTGRALRVDIDTLDEHVRALVTAHARTWRNEFVRDPVALRQDVVSLLERLGLARTDDHGLLLSAAAARYRPDLPEGTGP